MVLVSYILSNYVSILQTKFSDREGYKARRVGLETMRLCRKFSFETICGMITLPDQQGIIEAHDDGDQFQRGPFPPRDYPDGCALVCRVPTQHTPRRRTHGGT